MTAFKVEKAVTDDTVGRPSHSSLHPKITQCNLHKQDKTEQELEQECSEEQRTSNPTAKKTVDYNAFSINLAKGASLDTVKPKLKEYGGHFREATGRWSCPISKKLEIEELLSINNIKGDLKDCTDDYYNLTDLEKKAEDIYVRISFYEKEFSEKERQLIIDKEKLEIEIKTRNLMENDPLVSQKRRKLNERELEQVALRNEIEQLRNSAKLLEEVIDEWETPIPLPGGLPPVAILEPDMIPESLREWLMDIAERMQIPIDFPAVGSLVVLGNLIGRRMGILPKKYDDWIVVPNLWGMIIGRPGLMKSPALSEIMKPLDILVEKAKDEFDKKNTDYDFDKRIAEAKKKELDKRLQDAVKGKKNAAIELMRQERCELALPPIHKRFRTNDSTVEKISELLVDNPNGILIYRDELVGWLRSLDRDGREGDRQFFLESWNGLGSFEVDRIKRGSIRVPAICLGILGGTQPGPIASYVYQAQRGGNGDDGLIQRFGMITWPDAKKEWKNIDRLPDFGAADRAFEVFYKIADLTIYKDIQKQNNIPCIRFDIEAQSIFDEWRYSLELRVRNDEEDPNIASHLVKYRKIIPSLALIFQIADDLDRNVEISSVNKHAAIRAVKWASYLETHARRLYNSVSNARYDSARALLKKIESGEITDGFNARDVYRHGWSHLTNAEETKQGLTPLVENGWLKEKEVSRKKTIYRIHPSLRKA